MERIRKLLQGEVSIYGMGYSLPKNMITSEEVEKKIRNESHYSDFQAGIIYSISGTSKRYHADHTVQASSLAADAAQNALRKASLEMADIDCIIFASASQDMIEPATANMVQSLLGSTAPVFDVKNACNSFLNGLQVARSFIISGQYKNILVCSGETPSRVIQWSTQDPEEFKKAFAGYNLGDGGTAMILGPKKSKTPKVIFAEFMTQGSYNHMSTVAGGGSLFPRDLEKLYFHSDSLGLSQAFGPLVCEFTENILKKYTWNMESISYCIPHMVSRYSIQKFFEMFPFPHHRVLSQNSTHGNMASCSIPFSFIQACEQSKFTPGDRILLLGLGAGATYGLIGIEYR